MVMRKIIVYVDWKGLGGATKVGMLAAAQLRGKEVFTFSYDEVSQYPPHNERPASSDHHE